MEASRALVPGMAVPELQVSITRGDLVRYAGAADDYVDQHWDQAMMIESGFPDVVVHGWLTFAHMCRAVTNWLPPEIARIKSYQVRYVQPTYPGTIRCGGEVTSSDADSAHLSLWAENVDGLVTTQATMIVELTKSELKRR